MSLDIITTIANNTKEFLEKIPKDQRKKKGQFFTSMETAIFMADMFSMKKLPKDISILDPGAGSGILSAAIVQKLNDEEAISHIFLTCYETDPEIHGLLSKNLELIKELSRVPVDYELKKEDYILSQQQDFNKSFFAAKEQKKYDLIIANPPYIRIARDNPSATAMPEVVHGAPNLYFLFAAMSLFNLKDNSEMVYIIPRSWTSGLYFTQFRKYLLTEGKISQIHLFVSRDKVFKEEQVLQETMILKIKKTHKSPQRVTITSSNSNNDFNEITSFNAPYSSVVNGRDLYVFLPTNDEEMEVIKKIHCYSSTFPDEGIRMRTGIVVDFRQREGLRERPGEHIVPLFYSQHIRDGRVNHLPSGKGFDWITDEKKGLIQKNKNYVFCKRFTAKEEKRRLQCGIYLAKNFDDYSFIGTQNKINYVDLVDGSDMEESIVYGIYGLLNSTLFDKYYRILNGNTQVNSTEVNSIPVPPVDLICKIGEKIMLSNDLSTQNCDKIVMEIAYE